MRVNRFVASASGLSRRAADDAISAGRVTVNGTVATLGQMVEDSDRVTLGGKELHLPASFTYLMLNKPVGYITSRAEQGSAPTIYDLLPEQYRALRPAGRLDRDSSGLLLLSDDGDFVYRLTHPSQHKQKTYMLQLSRELNSDDVKRLRAGIELDDGLSQVRVHEYSGRRAIVLISEGRNRQLRRTFGAIGKGVVSLQRVGMGEYSLGDLPVGRWREFKPEAKPAAPEVKP
jgi:pseudouridine synthase